MMMMQNFVTSDVGSVIYRLNRKEKRKKEFKKKCNGSRGLSRLKCCQIR